MKICLIAEGCYPYITGGVSSWIQMLTESLPQHEFVIVAISAKHVEQTPKYKLPSNVTEIVDVYLELDEQEKVPRRRKLKLTFSEAEVLALEALISGGVVDWTVLLSCFTRYRQYKTVDFLMSEAFLQIVMNVAETKYPHIVFNHFFWSVRSMMVPFLQIVKHPLPKADIYHSVSTGYAGLMAALGKVLYEVPFVLTEHGIYTREREEEIIKADWVQGYFKDNWIQYFYELSDCAYQYADLVISLFEKSRELQIELGCLATKTRVISNGIDINRFKDVDDVPRHDGVIVGAIVRVVPIKDIKTLIQAFALVKQRQLGIKVQLHIIGPTDENPEYMEECEALIESLQLEDVLFTGRVAIASYIHQLDMVVLSSISEGQPLSTLEAMAAKKACICTDVGACDEMLKGYKDEFGPAGIIVPIMGSFQMANAIIELATDEVKRRQFGENGHQRVLTYYRQDQFIEQYRQVYEEVVK